MYVMYCRWFRNPAITTWDVKKTPVNNGINYQPQLVNAGDISMTLFKRHFVAGAATDLDCWGRGWGSHGRT